MDIYSNSISLKPVIYPIKEDNKVANNNKIFYQELKKLMDILEVKTKIVTDSITVIGIKIPLNIISITL